jgi:hypothetical protein
MVVNAENGVAWKAFEQSVGNHALSSAVFASLFGGLKDQVNSPRKVSGSSKMARRAQQHGRVAVVATGVHHAIP